MQSRQSRVTAGSKKIFQSGLVSSAPIPAPPVNEMLTLLDNFCNTYIFQIKKFPTHTRLILTPHNFWLQVSFSPGVIIMSAPPPYLYSMRVTRPLDATKCIILDSHAKIQALVKSSLTHYTQNDLPKKYFLSLCNRRYRLTLFVCRASFPIMLQLFKAFDAAL